jgi:hypothetical protein
VPKSQLWTRIFELKDRGVVGVIYGVNYGKIPRPIFNKTVLCYFLFPVGQLRKHLRSIIQRILTAAVLISLFNLVVLGQDFCNWTGEDMSLVLFPIAEVNMEEFAPVIEELQNGAQIEIHLTSEGNS